MNDHYPPYSPSSTKPVDETKLIGFCSLSLSPSAAYDDLESEQGSLVTARDSVIEGCKGYGIQARGEDVQVSVSASSRLSRNKLGEMNILQGATLTRGVS